MAGFTGEFECSVDSKGRVLFPAALRKQISPEAMERFVVNRGFDKHLNLFPMNEWNSVTTKMSTELNLFLSDHLRFHRLFHNGATELFLDGQGRLLLPKTLTHYAGIKKELVLYAFANRIEIWAKDKFDKMITDKSGEYAKLAEKVMGKKNAK